MKQCRKVKNYKTKKEAKKALRKERNQPLYLKGKYIKEARNYYHCKICNAYHLTSRK